MVIRREDFSLVLGRDAEKMAARSSPSDLSLTNIEGLCVRVRACVRERASVPFACRRETFLILTTRVKGR